MRDVIQILFFVLFVKPFLALFIGLRIYGRENAPKKHPFIIAANHSSHLDVLSLLNFFPVRELKHIRPVAAADYFERNRFISIISHMFFNILAISRHGITKERNPLNDLKKALHEKQSLILFPEGTRSETGDMGAFHSGIVYLTQECPDIPVIPVYLSNLGRCLPKGEYLPVPFIAEVRIGKPMLLSGNRKEAVEQLRNAIVGLKETP